MELVYVASPYAGDIEQNVENAKAYCRYVMKQGYVPLASHLLYPQMLDDTNLKERQLGTQLGIELLERCNVLWVFGETVSSGMAAEIAAAEGSGIPILKVSDEQVFGGVSDNAERREALFLVQENGRTHYFQTAYARGSYNPAVLLQSLDDARYMLQDLDLCCEVAHLMSGCCYTKSMLGIPAERYGTLIFQQISASQAGHKAGGECITLDFDADQMMYSNLKGTNIEISLPFDTVLELLRQTELAVPQGVKREELLERKLTERMIEEMQTLRSNIRLGG